MKPRIVLLAALLTGAGCTLRSYVPDVPAGAFTSTLTVRSEPTTAEIYIDGRKAGRTPVRIKLWHNRSRTVRLTALPLYEDQFRQEISLDVPSIPRRLTVFMTTPPPLPDAAPATDTVPATEHVPAAEPPEPVRQIFFPFNGTEVDSTYIPVIAGIAGYVLRNPGLRVSIHGYADETGRKAYNLRISLERAHAVKRMLTAAGVPAASLAVFGHGETTTVRENGYVLETSLNRKVECRIEPAENR